MPLISRAQLAKIAPHADARIVVAIVDHADRVLPRHGLATQARLTDFMAHVLVESAYLTCTHEDLNYSAERLHQVWPSRFPTVAAAEPYAHNPEALADKVYGGRMGNTGPGDGWLNRGQGLLETTGHDNIARLARYLGRSLAETRVLLTSDAGMLDGAAATYVMLGAPACADRGDIVGSTRAVNGGSTGLADRRAMRALCRKVWPRLDAPPAKTALAPAAKIPAPPAAPAIPPQPKATPMSKAPTLLATILAAIGISITAAHAGTIDLTPMATAGIDYVLVPLFMALVPAIGAILVMPLRRYLDQATADTLARRIDDLLDKSIAFGAQQAATWVAREDFHANVDGWIASIAADYASAHAPALIQQAGGVLVQKIQARLGSHEDVLALKSIASANDNTPSAPLDLTSAAAKAV